jgi:hypothetical protein
MPTDDPRLRLQEALQEVRAIVAQRPDKQALLAGIDEALASGDAGRMRRMLAQFDHMETQQIQRLRRPGASPEEGAPEA